MALLQETQPKGGQGADTAGDRRPKLLAIIDQLCQTSMCAKTDTADPDLLQQAQDLFVTANTTRANEGITHTTTASTSACPTSPDGLDATTMALQEITSCHAVCEARLQRAAESTLFECMEDFVAQAQKTGKQRRIAARTLAAQEELRLQAETCQAQELQQHDDARYNPLYGTVVQEQKAAQARRAHMRRKMVVAQAAQQASRECRLQFAASRQFMQDFHVAQQDNLARAYRSRLYLVQLCNALQGKDTRTCALDEQIEQRLYQKRSADMTEHYMACSLEEAQYLESVLALMDSVQRGKEAAAQALLELQLEQTYQAAQAAQARQAELQELRNSARQQVAALAASTLAIAENDLETATDRQTLVDRLERRKEYQDCGTVLTVSELYDQVLWSIATSTMNMSSTTSCGSDEDVELEPQDSLEDSSEEDNARENNHGKEDERYRGVGDYKQDDENIAEELQGIAEGEDDDEDHENNPNDLWIETACNSSNSYHDKKKSPGMAQSQEYISDDDTSVESASTGGRNRSNYGGTQPQRSSPVGQMQMHQLKKTLQKQEKTLLLKHKKQEKTERRAFRAAMRALKRKNQMEIDSLIEQSLVERQKLRQGIKRRLSELVKRQEASTAAMHADIETDLRIMREALMAEHKRLEDTKDESFADAQTLISAQVFHEIRNALSSVIAMSELTSSLNNDQTASPEERTSSVDGMMQQLKVVVEYSTSILNNILDLSKLKNNSLTIHPTDFDVQRLVANATTMQLSKAKVPLQFVPSFDRVCVAHTDKDIVTRIMTNLVSNAVKFTPDGAIEPFIWPLEQLDPKTYVSEKERYMATDHFSSPDWPLQLNGRKARIMAIGVVDTGPGMSQEMLETAKMGVVNPQSSGTTSHGAKNSGFGLHLCHCFAESLGSRLHLLKNTEDALKLLHKDTLRAISTQQKSRGGTRRSRGTVLYFTLLVYENDKEAKDILLQHDSISMNTNVGEDQYIFRPKPSPASQDGTFRILVADDVLMLRKGLVNTLSTIFKDCPVSISTACSAEDMLRAVQTNPYDLIICDNLFHHDPDKLKRLLPNEGEEHGRPRIHFDCRKMARSDLRKAMIEFFNEERFTVEEGDGQLLGADAVVQLAQMENPPFSVPLIMLLSGHTITDMPSHLGIITAQKPLKQTELCPLLEAAAPRLLKTSLCGDGCSGTDSETEISSNTSDESSVMLYNRQGARIFEHIQVNVAPTHPTK